MTCEFTIKSEHLQQDLRLALKKGEIQIECSDFEHIQVEPSESEFILA